MRRVAIVISVLVILLGAVPVMAGDAGDVSNIQLIPGRFNPVMNSGAKLPAREAPSQLIATVNNGPPIFDLIVECAFFKGPELVSTGRQGRLSISALPPTTGTGTRCLQITQIAESMQPSLDPATLRKRRQSCSRTGP
jgi:hypothetical protein